MSATGSITLTRNSTAVTGNGTAFTTDLAVGGFVVATTGGTAYTLGVKSIESDTSLTLQIAYKGPTASGLSFDYVPFATLNLITSALAAQVNEALRASNLDRDNWQQIFSGTGNVTVTMPDGRQWTGPAWNSIADTVASKANKTDLDAYAKKGSNSDITEITGLTTALTVSQGGTGGKTQADARTNLGLGTASTKNTGISGDTVPLLSGSNTWSGSQKASAQIGTYLNVTQGTASNTPSVACELIGGYSGAFSMYCDYIPGTGPRGNLSINNFGYTSFWQFNGNGSALAVNGSWNNGSDERIKDSIQRIDKPLEKMKQLKGVTWIRKDTGNFGIGFIAQDVEKIWPAAVVNTGYDLPMPDGSTVKNMKALNAGEISSALHHEAILSLMSVIDDLKEKIATRDTAIQDLQERLKALDGLDA